MDQNLYTWISLIVRTVLMIYVVRDSAKRKTPYRPGWIVFTFLLWPVFFVYLYYSRKMAQKTLPPIYQREAEIAPPYGREPQAGSGGTESMGTIAARRSSQKSPDFGRPGQSSAAAGRSQGQTHEGTGRRTASAGGSSSPHLKTEKMSSARKRAFPFRSGTEGTESSVPSFLGKCPGVCFCGGSRPPGATGRGIGRGGRGLQTNRKKCYYSRDYQIVNI
jgi:hypothetical protein